MMVKRILAVWVMFLMLWFVFSINFLYAAQNMLQNGGFEEEEDGKPAGWEIYGQGEVTLDDSVKHSGKRSMRIEVIEGTGVSVYQALLDLKEGKTYSVSCWFKTKDVVPGPEGGFAYLTVYQYSTETGDFSSITTFKDFVQLKDTNDWRKYTFTFAIKEGTVRVDVKAGFYLATGIAWVDDYSLVEGSKPVDFSAGVKVLVTEEKAEPEKKKEEPKKAYKPSTDIQEILAVDLPLQEGAGEEVEDLSGNKNYGIINGAKWVEGREGKKALYFDGSDNYVEIVGDNLYLDPKNGVKIDVWVKPNNITDGQYMQFIVSKGRDYYASGYNLFQREGKIGLRIRTVKSGDAGYEVLSDEPVLRNGVWSHIVGIYNANDNEVLLYHNDKLVKEAEANGSIEYIYDEPLTIGMMAWGKPTWFRFDGTIEQVKVWTYMAKRKEEEVAMRNIANAVFGIYKDSTVSVKESTPSDPNYLAGALKEKGWKVVFLNSEDLIDSEKFNKKNIDVIVLPYGSAFPGPAADNLRKFLRTGGNFISMGGYAFNNILTKVKGKWVALDEESLKEKIIDENFDRGLPDGWQAGPGCEYDDSIGHKGKGCLKVSSTDPLSAGRWTYEMTGLRKNQRMFVSAWMKTEDIGGPHFAFMAIYQYDSLGKLVEFKDFIRLCESSDWKEYTHPFIVNSSTDKVLFHAGIWDATGNAYFDEVKIYALSGEEMQINTSFGRPADALEVKKEQIGVFDPSYKFWNVSYIGSDPEQFLFDKDIKLDGKFEGYASSCVLGSDNVRWISLINCYDRYGRSKGSAGAIAYHYSGSYRKSGWAFSGITNADIFSPKNEGMKKVFLAMARAVLEKTFLSSIVPSLYCYRQGESVTVSVKVNNYGTDEQKGIKVKFQILDEEEKNILFENTSEIPLPAGFRKSVSITWAPAKFDYDFYAVRAYLLKNDKPIDMMKTGFAVWNEEVVKKGFQLSYKNNYFYAGKKSMFLIGSDSYSNMFNSLQHSPLTWRRDFSKAQDFGHTIWNQLQFHYPPTYKMPEKDWRKFDAFNQMLQKFKQVNFPSLLCCHDVATPDASLKLQQKYCAQYADRYKNMPGLIYSLDSDYQNNPKNETTDIKRMWNSYLKKRYGTTEKLKEAWKDEPPIAEIGNIDWEEAKNAKWTNIKLYDCYAFRIELMKRWNKAISEAIRNADPNARRGEDGSVCHPITSEYYAYPYEGVDVIASADDLDVGNNQHFEPPERDLLFPRKFRYTDQRPIGKAINLGEFGVKTHPAWKLEKGGIGYFHIYRTEEERNTLFLFITHCAMGMGGSKITNWCWDDAHERIFPWGINYPCDSVPKDTLYLYRDCQLFFRPFDLTYTPASIYCIIPESHRWVDAYNTTGMIWKFIHYFIANHLDFASLVETKLAQLPKEAKVLLYPIPFCPPDNVYNAILDFVKGGGTLIMTGDISYDELRNRTRTNRLKELCGVEFTGENYPNIDYKKTSPTKIIPEKEFLDFPKYEGYPCIKIKPTTAKVVANASGIGPVVVVNTLGEGKVIYSTDIPEVWAKEFDNEPGVSVAKALLKLAGVKPNEIIPNDPEVYLFKLSTLKNETIYTLYNTKKEKVKVTVSTLAGKISMEIDSMKPGLICLTSDNKITSLEASGEVKKDNETIASGNSHFMIMSMDNQDITSSKALLYMPITVGDFKLNTKATWLKPYSEMGELRKCKWTKLESIIPAYDKLSLSFKTDNQQRFDIFLINEQDELPKYANMLGNWYSSPEEITR